MEPARTSCVSRWAAMRGCPTAPVARTRSARATVRSLSAVPCCSARARRSACAALRVRAPQPRLSCACAAGILWPRACCARAASLSTCPRKRPQSGRTLTPRPSCDPPRAGGPRREKTAYLLPRHPRCCPRRYTMRGATRHRPGPIRFLPAAAGPPRVRLPQQRHAGRGRSSLAARASGEACTRHRRAQKRRGASRARSESVGAAGVTRSRPQFETREAPSPSPWP
mmetsp:Transcript_21476/g.55296  ORF Transcript_21476/g.55296 Transcript_21476/m.55296 type:complete len:226 (+) Transcript_21476:328-1005(+)